MICMYFMYFYNNSVFEIMDLIPFHPIHKYVLIIRHLEKVKQNNHFLSFAIVFKDSLYKVSILVKKTKIISRRNIRKIIYITQGICENNIGKN